MRHFISFQKKKALYLEPGDAHNDALAHELNHELMAVGYVLTRDAFERVASQHTDQLEQLHRDLTAGLRRVVGGGGHEPIYRNFPQSVLALSYQEFVINALIHYWSDGQWRPEDAEAMHRELRFEPVELKPVALLNETAFNRIFTDMLYSEVSLSAFDKQCVDWYLDHGGPLEFAKIRFKETASYVGQRLLATASGPLPIRSATTLLRIWAAHSGGDEGLKANTRFKNPTTRQRSVLMSTLDQCTDLEDSFKTHRGKWLRLLFFLHPRTPDHAARYPKLAAFTDRLRNHPKTLQTFNAKAEALLQAKSPELFKLLAKRPGVFMRRLDHLVRVFGIEAFYQWFELPPTFAQLVTVFNHFSTRGQPSAGRAAVLAGQAKSELVTYKALEPLPTKLVERITTLLMERLKTFTVDELAGPVFIDPGLYYVPLATNNRASSLALDGKVIGETEHYSEQATLRLYVHWEGRSDIDLSGFMISRDNRVMKVGWNAAHHAGEFVIYSGDNTGVADKNAEYLDINTRKIPEDVEWIVTEARIFRGPTSFAGYQGTVHMGWMSRRYPEANRLWQPKTLAHARVMTNEGTVAYLMAYHPRSQSIVHLDMSMGTARVSTAADAIRVRVFLERIASVKSQHSASWERLNQGHILELLAGRVVEEEQGAEVVFGGETTAEQVSALMVRAERRAGC
jgi:hypothetical protein